MEQFHFLRPLWLLLIPGALLLILAWRLNSDPRHHWRRYIAPHLLEALIVGESKRFRVRPVHTLAMLLMLAGLAAAGPVWEQEPPPFSQDLAPIVVAVDLSRSMDAIDIPPTRLERVKQKIHDLMALRRGARTGLIVYAGTAHLVLPPSDDPALMDTFLEALATDLMPVRGKNATAAITEATRLLTHETAAGTIVLFTDGFDTRQTPGIVQHRKQHPEQQILVIAVGTERGGPLRGANDQPILGASGKPVSGIFDGTSLKQLASNAGVPLASLTLDSDDIEWIQRRAEKHLQAVEAGKAQLRWKEAGYWLCFPVALIAALSSRRGWVLRWLPVLLIAFASATPKPAVAGDLLLRLFMTADQQGRWYFERGDYAEAARRFDNPAWRAWASYRAGRYGDALEQFARSDTPEGYLMMGNCYAQLGDYLNAVRAYDNALKLRTSYPDASANRMLVAALIPKPKMNPHTENEQPDDTPDEIKFDNKTGKSDRTMQTQQKQLSTEIWMRNLKVSPADFLRAKFADQAHAANEKGSP